MLSPGQWHKQVPKGPLENRRFRLATLKRALVDKPLRKALLEGCRQDILFYINTFVWQFNPKKKGLEAAAPFITYPFQDAMLLAGPDRPDFQIEGVEHGLLWCYEHDRNAVVEKSREMGASWIFLIVQDWLCRFNEHVQTLNISRNEKYVDSASQDSLFWKLRFLQRHLPEWMRGEIDDQKNYLGYQATNSAITGEATTGSAGVGGRASFILVDEMSKIRQATELRQRTANTADVRFFNSTHEGTGTEFYRLTQTPEIVKITLHWTAHPEKRRGLYRSCLRNGKPDVIDTDYQFPPDFQFVLDGTPTGGPHPGLRSPWYDKKCKEMGGEVAAAVEMDINPAGSVSQFFPPQLIRELQAAYCRRPDFEGDVLLDPGGLVKEFRARENGPLKLWLRFDHKGLPSPDVFAFGADLSWGRGGAGSTNSCLSGYRCKTGDKVLEYATPFLEPNDFACVSVALCKFFAAGDGQGARLVWERQGPGDAFGKKVQELGYRNVYTEQDEKNPMLYGQRKVQTPGWQPNRQNTLVLMQDYQVGLRERKCVNPSEIALEECLYWAITNEGLKHSGKSSKADPSGAGVNHGDRSMADALGWMLTRGKLEQIREREDKRVDPRSLQWRREVVEQAEYEAAEV